MESITHWCIRQMKKSLTFTKPMILVKHTKRNTHRFLNQIVSCFKNVTTIQRSVNTNAPKILFQ